MANMSLGCKCTTVVVVVYKQENMCLNRILEEDDQHSSISKKFDQKRINQKVIISMVDIDKFVYLCLD